MAVRKDSKNRILRNGEYQRKDGRYMYRYVGSDGKNHFVYSWTLTTTDRTTKNRQAGLCLRELELEIEKDLQDGINTISANKITLDSFFDEYMSQRKELRTSTRNHYKYFYDTYISKELGKRKITDIKYSDVKRFYNLLFYTKSLKPNTMELINNILHPIFKLAVKDGYIRTNPANGVLAEIKKGNNWDKEKRHALTIPQQNAFINFLKSDEKYSRWKLLFLVCLGTGCRIGELLSLTWENCDFSNSIIKIKHTLVYVANEQTGEREFHITTPKTNSSIREIPMFNFVKELLLEEKLRQMREGFNTSVIDGVSGFVFSNKNNKVHYPCNVNKAIDRLIEKYNSEEIQKAEQEKREPLLLPHFSVHNLRHTFCTRMCENESNIKVIQEIMGHSSISTKMDIYNEATREKKRETFAALEEKINIG